MIAFDRFSFTYPNRAQPALRDVTLNIPDGAFALLTGATGSGKSTLLRCLNGLTPHFSGGAATGNVRVFGLDAIALGPKLMSRHVGFVFQDPEAQFVTDTVADEIAFALENSGLPRPEMRIRVEESLDLLDLAPLRERRLAMLSGGERQRVAIAAALALRPRVLALDEPTSQLDPKSAEDVLHALTRLNADLGLSIMLSEHRLERVLAFADVVLALDADGHVHAHPPRTAFADASLTLAPPLVQLARRRGWRPLPLTVKEGRRFSTAEAPPAAMPSSGARTQPRTRTAALSLDRVRVNYGAQRALKQVSLAIDAGEALVLLGRNGSGKSTLLKRIVGLAPAHGGSIRLDGNDITGTGTAEICRRVGYVPQDPGTLLFAETVRDELAITLRNHGHPRTDAAIAALLDELGLLQHAAAYPRDLSAGQRQLTAFAAIAIAEPALLLLDEPTRGLDYDAKNRLLHALHRRRANGVAILLVTHDIEWAVQLADRVIMLSQGEILADGMPRALLPASPLFAPQVARLFPDSGWLTVTDAEEGMHANS